MKLIKFFVLLYIVVFFAGTSGPLNATVPTPPPTEAPAGVDNLTADSVTANQAQHLADLQTFEEVDTIDKGLGPVFNMRSCVACHQQPVTGGISQVTELRAGSVINGQFFPATVVVNKFGVGGPVTIAGRSLINQEATCSAVIADAAW